MPRQELRGYQLARLRKLLTDVVPHNRFYAEKFARVECLPLESLEQLDLLLRHASLHRFRRHELVVRRGEPLEHVWLVLEGSLEVASASASGRRFIANYVPVGQAMELYRGLKDRGKPAELVFYPREGHGFTEYYHLQDRLNRIRDWVTSHVQGEGARSTAPRQ